MRHQNAIPLVSPNCLSGCVERREDVSSGAFPQTAAVSPYMLSGCGDASLCTQGWRLETASVLGAWSSTASASRIVVLGAVQPVAFPYGLIEGFAA